MKRVALVTLSCAVVIGLAAGPVSALPQFKKDFTDKYVEPAGDEVFKDVAMKAGCNVCHVKGEGKEARNAYGEELAKYIEGSAKDRLAAAGYTSYHWAENLGCRSGDPNAAVLGSHLFFQAEKSTNGGHYVNMVNANYDRVGVGVWVASNRVRLVVDFYRPR